MPVAAQCCFAVTVVCTTPGGDHITKCYPCGRPGENKNSFSTALCGVEIPR